MRIQGQIESKLNHAFSPQHLDVINESHNHSVPTGSESHFKVVVVSESFADLNRIQRHRAVHHALAHELSHDIHALTMHLYTTKEWEVRRGAVADSPNCRGGSKS